MLVPVPRDKHPEAEPEPWLRYMLFMEKVLSKGAEDGNRDGQRKMLSSTVVSAGD